MQTYRKILIILFLSFTALSSHAQEPFATYPQLPVGYSSIKVFDQQGRFAGRILPEKRYWVSIDRIPQFLQKGVVAVEDARFYEHSGIDVRGIARAVVKDVIKRRLAEGGSTITQQLIKNKFLSGEKSIDRKLQEGLMAIDFEKKYSKRQILEMYFNEIYYGNGAWGIAQAARLYFDKNPEDLTDGECAILAGVQKNPGRYNPLGKPADVVKRRDVVLKRMVDLDMISTRQQQELRAKPPAVIPPGSAQQYLAHVRAKLVERYGIAVVEQGGLEVRTAMDLNLQLLAEKTLAEGVRKLSPQLQGALVCMDPLTGDVLAAAGGVDTAKNPYNRAFYAKRQPGSSIKPLIYATALEKGITAASIWSDVPVDYTSGSQVWSPRNYDGKSYGDQTLRQALAHSNNVIAVKLLDTVGVPTFADQALKMGLMLRNRDLSLALGTEEVTPVELVTAYAPLANGGSRPEPRTILRVYDRNRRAWIENNQPLLTPALSPAAAYVTTQMLRDVLTYGTAKGLKNFGQERPSAGKTGTTNDYRDAWFVGYTPQMIAGVWVGHDKPRPGGKGFTGGAVAAPIWGRFMRQALAGKPAADFQRPETAISLTVDPATGQLAAPDCPEKVDELFIAGFEPDRYCVKHGGADIPSPVPPPIPPAAAPAPAPADSGQLPERQP